MKIISLLCLVRPDGVLIGKRKKLKQFKNNRGYLYVKLQNKTYMVHRLVALCFQPNPLNKPYVNHKGGVKTHNTVDNLEWCTRLENVRHAFRTGLISKEGRINSIKALRENNPNPRLPDKAIAEIRNRFKKRCPVNGATSLAREFNVSTVTISYIVNRRKHYA